MSASLPNDIGQIEPEWNDAVDDTTTPFTPRSAYAHVAFGSPLEEHVRAMRRSARTVAVTAVLVILGLVVLAWVIWG